MRAALIALAIFCSSGGRLIPEVTEFGTIETAPFVFEPSVRADLTFASERSSVGWGSFDLTAVPESDEIRVNLLLGLPSATRRWAGCKSISLQFDDTRRTATAIWAGVAMREGTYDAVRAHLTIEDIRGLLRARDAAAEVCGDRFELSEEERAPLRGFVEQFDEIGTGHGPSAPSPPYELTEEHEFFPEEPLNLPLPA